MRDTGKPTVTAFVGRSFADVDRDTWYAIREILESYYSLGFRWEDAKEAVLSPISQKIREGIERNQIYIGVMTRRRSYCAIGHESTLFERLAFACNPKPPKDWSTSEWVIEEVGYAIGCGRKVLLLIESGVVFPTTDLDADTQWLPFSRTAISDLAVPLSQVITRLASEKFPAPAADASSPPPERVEDTVIEKGQDTADYAQFCDALLSNDLVKAEEIQKAMLARQQNVDDGLECLLLEQRAARGDSSAYTELKGKVANGKSQDAIASFARVQVRLGNITEAEAALRSGIEVFGAKSEPEIVEQLARLYLRKREFEPAMKVAAKLLSVSAGDNDTGQALQTIADIAKEMKLGELELAARERLISIEPTNADQRFSLSYLYSQLGWESAAVFHYRIVQRTSDMPGAVNNLAVSLGAIGLQGQEVANYKQIAQSHALAKANLSHAYIRSGDLELAEKLASESASEAAEHDDLARARAAAAISDISEIKSKETARLLGLENETSALRKFFAESLEARLAPTPDSFSATYKLLSGDMKLSLTSTTLSGKVSERVEHTGGVLSYIKPGLNQEKPLVSIKTTVFSADLRGRAGAFKLTQSSEWESSGGQFGESAKVGELFLGADERTLTLLEGAPDVQKAPKIYTLAPAE